jgi:hypothetical protein
LKYKSQLFLPWEIVKFYLQLFCKLFENTIFRISLGNWAQKCYSIKCRPNKTKNILSNINRSIRIKVCISEHSCKPIWLFVTRDNSNCLIFSQPSDHEQQKHLFCFSKFYFIVEKIALFSHLWYNPAKWWKNGSYLAVLNVIDHFWGKIVHIFGIHVKNCIEPYIF